MNKTEAALLLGINEGALDTFDVEDTFNSPNRITGFLSHQSDHRYGALLITQVNGLDVSPQLVYATPKLHYPFATREDGDRSYHFPKVVQSVLAYEKKDGTNIASYVYKDSAGNLYRTYKTRLTPVVVNNKFGSLRDMWQELMDTCPNLHTLLARVSTDQALSFEMYGSRNPLLVRYPFPLKATLLFGVHQDGGKVIPAITYLGYDHVHQTSAVMQSGADLVKFFETLRDEAEAKNVRGKDENGDDYIDGTEGYVLDVLDGDGKWTLWKCKPTSIEAIHWAGTSIPESIILPTAWNALESCVGELTVEYVVQLLLEEFTQEKIDTSMERIEKVVAQVKKTLVWREKVREAYDAVGMTFDPDMGNKGTVMRALSAHFDRSDMKRVFSALLQLGLVKPYR